MLWANTLMTGKLQQCFSLQWRQANTSTNDGLCYHTEAIWNVAFCKVSYWKYRQDYEENFIRIYPHGPNLQYTATSLRDNLAQSRRQAIILTRNYIPVFKWSSEFSWCPATLLGSYNYLTHWGRDKMDAISQTTFSNAFSWMKMHEFRLRFHWS